MTKEERQKSIEEKMNAVYINKQGIQCRILKYRSFHDVDVIFNDGVIKEHLDCKNLQAGQFSHPKDIPNAENRIGEISYSNDKMEAKIVKYNSSTDFIIQFEDGTEKHLCSWKDFKEGKFSYKYDEGFKLSEAEIKKRKSRLIKNKSGYEMRILNYHSSTDVDVIFEDGTIVKNKIYSNFENGKITHPKYKTLKSDKLKLIQSNGNKDIVRFNNKQDFDNNFLLHQCQIISLMFFIF